MSRHLGSLASDYVDRRLDPARLASLDRHLVTCPGCRAKADEERTLLSAMRAGPRPHVPEELRESLLGLAAATPLSRPPTAAVPAPPPPPRGLRLPVVEPATPALHRSPLRATVLAGLAASASAAVAWGLAPAATPSAPAVTSASQPASSVVQAAVPPASVDSFTRAQTSWVRPAVLTERLGR